jgi:hypothetical protein
MKKPNYDKNKYKIWALPHPLILHWVINPGLVLNELILGQRLPKVTLIDKQSDKAMMERSIVPCPHCNAMNDGRIWGKGNAFGHWFGYICPNCHKIIPCLWNIFSFIILCVTFPIWYLPVRLLKDKWIAFEKKRLEKVSRKPLIKAKKINWIIRGAFLFGGIMWLILSFIPFLFGKASLENTLLKIPIFLIAGLTWGLIMQLLMNKRGKKPNKINNNKGR